MSNTPARVPFSRLAASTFAGVDQNFQRIERQQQGLFQPKVITHARTGYQVQASDWLILADATDGVVSIVFPDAARLDGLRVTVVKTDASTHAVTLTGTFSGLTNPTLAAQYRAKQIDAGNGVWYFTPELSASDIQPGTFPSGTFTFPTLSVTGALTFGGHAQNVGTEDSYVNLGTTPQAVSFAAGGDGTSVRLFLKAANLDTCTLSFSSGLISGSTVQSSALAAANCAVTKTTAAGIDTYAIVIPGNPRTYSLVFNTSNGGISFKADATATGTTKLIALATYPVF
jgi:hypothetical protein